MPSLRVALHGGAEMASLPGGLCSPPQVVHSECRGLQAEAGGAGAQRHGLGGPQLLCQQHGDLRGSEAQGWVQRAGVDRWATPSSLGGHISGARRVI